MSIECGVVMAFLTKRFLLLDGNQAPPANIVDYNGRVDNSKPSRITDLIEIPIPWTEAPPDAVADLDARELTSQNLMDCVFYVPGSVDIESADAADFARGRSTWICEDAGLSELPLLRVSETPLIPGSDSRRHNLSFYSYLFYLDREHRKAVYDVLSRMQAKRPYAELAQRVASDLGAFNAVHLRRGDFKLTYGVTVLDRNPWEAIEAMERHFGDDKTLVICTDERDDPFFGEITQQWPDHLFIDHHILDHYGAEFAALPQHDSLALAYLSQLVAAESADFIGSMTSTFTALIQRLRGSRGKHEPFKFLWNELPEPGEELKRGSHPVSECVPLENGEMVPEYEGNYSWNRYSQLINPAWMREWPESFLTAAALESGTLPREAMSDRPTKISAREKTQFRGRFDDLEFSIECASPAVAARFSQLFDTTATSSRGTLIQIEEERRGGIHLLSARGSTFAELSEPAMVPDALFRELIPILARARKGNSWFDGAVLVRDQKRLLLVGDWRSPRPGSSIVAAAQAADWSLVAEEAVPIKVKGAALKPFTHRFDNNEEELPLDGIIYCSHKLHSRSSVFPLSPAVAVAELVRTARDFEQDREAAVKRLCALVEQVPVYQFDYAQERDTPVALSAVLEQLQHPQEIAS